MEHIANVNHWRGVWDTLDLYTGVGWASASWSLGIGISGLILLRAFRNILAPPALIAVDGPEEYFTYPTMFSTYVRNNTLTHCNIQPYNRHFNEPKCSQQPGIDWFLAFFLFITISSQL